MKYYVAYKNIDSLNKVAVFNKIESAYEYCAEWRDAYPLKSRGDAVAHLAYGDESLINKAEIELSEAEGFTEWLD